MNKQLDSSKLLDILLRNTLLEQITWDKPEDKKRYQYQSLQTKSADDVNRRKGTERIENVTSIPGWNKLKFDSAGHSTQDFSLTYPVGSDDKLQYYKNGRVQDKKGNTGTYKFISKPKPVIEIKWDAKKYGKASEQGLDPRFYTVLFLIIGIGGGGFGVAKLIKFLKGKGVTLRYLMRGGIYKDAWNWFRGKNGKVNMEAGVEKLYTDGHITRELRDEMLERLKNPQIAIEMETAFMQQSLREFMKGGPNAPTAKEFLASLTDKLKDKYGEQIRNIERTRTKPATVSKIKPTRMSSITPKAVKTTYTKIPTVTAEQFDKVINGTKAQSIIDNALANYNSIAVRAEINKLKNAIISGKASKINKNFKSISEFETFMKKLDSKFFYNREVELEWTKYRLKQLFK